MRAHTTIFRPKRAVRAVRAPFLIISHYSIRIRKIHLIIREQITVFGFGFGVITESESEGGTNRP